MAGDRKKPEATTLPLFGEADPGEPGSPAPASVPKKARASKGRPQRQDGAGWGVTLPPIASRIVDAAEAVSADPPDRIDYLHSVLCQVGLPRRKAEGDVFERSSGAVSMLVKAGELWDGKRWVPQPLPYGTRPRLALIHISSEAIRTKSRMIEVGSSVREFLLKLGADTGGHEYKRFQQQMKALAACEMKLGLGISTVRAQPIERFDAWLHATGRQATLWPGVLQLSDRFLETLLEFAVPMDPRALAALRHSALALDVYTWLTHRLHRVRQVQGVKLSWGNLREQFGQEYSDPKNFKREMKKALHQALAVYPEARIDETPGGIVLLPSPSPIAKPFHQVLLPATDKGEGIDGKSGGE